MERLRLRSNPHRCEGTGARVSIIREKENGGGAWEPLRACDHPLAAQDRAHDHTRRRAGRGAWCGLGARQPPSSPSRTPSPPSRTPSPPPRLSIPAVDLDPGRRAANLIGTEVC
ncbi:unnamed protein product [Miscanthus lutarioriparius]|uniref:Uncharacterized protein n=1 Tax=Miscanthus lutarioriparius TaxID=422564 RepID=A0A811PQN0_9POAL|nr:unnamed protein product [Miscanthus lutarioriparius]